MSRRLGQQALTGAPKWAQRQLEGLVAAIIVLRHEGDESHYQYLKDDVDAIIDYYGLDPDAVYNMYGDPDQPATIEQARRVVANPPAMKGAALGIAPPPTRAGYSVCVSRYVGPRPRHGSVEGLIYDERARKGLAYRILMDQGKFQRLDYGRCVKLTEFGSAMEAFTQEEQEGEWNVLCIETVSWDRALEVVLSDIPQSRGSDPARKRLRQILTQEAQGRCFGRAKQ